MRPYRKGVPEKLKKISLSNRGDTASAHYGPLSCLKYQDAKTVYFLSTTESSHTIETGLHDFHQNLAKIRPSMVHIYDQKMDAVDRHNEMVENNKVPFKTLKWWKKLILHIINLSIVNRISYTKNAAKLQHQCYSAIFGGSWLNS